MRGFHCLVVSILFLSVTKAQEKNDSTLMKISENKTVFNRLFDTVDLNPAQQYLRKTFSISEMGVSVHQRKNDAFLLQKEKEVEAFHFGTKSYYRIDPFNIVWGEASYVSGKRNFVRWNESSDYDIVFPYVSADSIGGNMQSETYEISGGYGSRINTHQFGIEASYRAMNEYRNIDPRPKNVISDFKIRLGVAKEIHRYNIGLDGFYRQYSQSNSVKFYKILGAPPLYHMTGLGTYNHLFIGNKLESYYDGYGWGGSLSVIDIGREGLMMNMGYKRFRLDKIMTSFQDLVSSGIVENRFFGKVDYPMIGAKYNTVFSISGSIRNRVGEEGIFHNQTSSNYIRLGKAERYRYSENSILFSAAVERKNKLSSWAVTPFAGLVFIDETYQKKLIRQSFTKVNYGIDFRFPFTLGNTLLGFYYKVQMMNNIHHHSAFGYVYPLSEIQEMVYENFNFLRSDYFQMDWNVRFNFKVFKNRYCFVNPGMVYQIYPGKKNMGFHIMAGFVL